MRKQENLMTIEILQTSSRPQENRSSGAILGKKAMRAVPEWHEHSGCPTKLP